jgi:tRNA(Ile)-lysidine synthase
MALAARSALKGSRRVEAVVRRTVAGRHLVLAVSGGRDSMALMHAVARAAPETARVVATFDHGTGAAATRASGLAASEAARLGFPVVLGHAASRPEGGRASEAEWRADRLAFLRDVAARVARDAGRAVWIATAHTRDDQVETVLMRVLRNAGARGLAGLYAGGEVVRPLLECSRAEVAEYVEGIGAHWVDDPTNDSMRYFRNRVRRDLLPALARVQPGLDDDLLSLARGAAEWRDRVDAIASAISRVDRERGVVSVAAEQLNGYSRAELSVLWPAIAARVGLAMDWRGTVRAAAFTTESRVGARIQLSGGWEIWRSRHLFELGRWR